MKNVTLWCLGGAALLAACNDEVNIKVEDANAPAFAVQLSDYESAGVALLNADGEVVSRKYISSGSELPGLSAALAGDIGLPTTPCDPERLTVLARKGGDYVLQVDFESDEVVHQVKTQTDESEGAYESNPNDILCLGDGRALVTRWEPNLTPEPPSLDQGDDLLLVDLEEETIEERIDLSSFRSVKVGENEDGGEIESTVYARPQNIVKIGDYAVVGLSRLTDAFDTEGKGALALVRLSNFEVTKVELPELVNCGFVTPVADRDNAVLVSCAGSPYGDAATAGLAIVAVVSGQGKVEATFQSSGDLPPLFSGVVSLGGTRALAVNQDYVANTPDEAYDLDLESGSATPVFEAKAPGDIGSGWYNAEKKLLLVPDINVGVRRFEVGEELEELEAAELSATLPARAVRPVR